MKTVNNWRVQNSSLLLVLFILLNFQVLRYLTPLYLLAILFLYFILFMKPRKRLEYFSGLYQLLFFYLLMNFYILFISFYKIGISETILAGSRAWFVFPLFFLSYTFINNEEKLSKFIAAYFYIVAIAGASLIYQVFFDAIPWLVQASKRMDLARNPSLLGALPIYGSASGFAIVLYNQVKANSYVKLFLLFVITIGIFITLQKAAIANLFIAFFLILATFFLNPIKLETIIKNFFGVVFLFILVSLIGIQDKIESYLNAAKLFVSGKVNFGHLFIEDFLSRVSGGFISQFISFSDLRQYEIVAGVGYYGAGGSLGLPNGYMAHNGFGDILLQGGLPFLFLFFTIIFYVFVLTIKLIRKDKISRNLGFGILSFFAIFFINIPVTSGIFVNPSLCSLFWILIGYIARLEKS